MDPLNGPVVILLESDSHDVAPVQEALLAIQPQIQLLIVPDLQNFNLAISKQHQELGTEAQIILAILSGDAKLSPEAIKEILKMPRDFELLVTSFEHSPKLVKEWADSGVFNLLQKPYDTLLLQQHLRLALKPTTAPRDFATHNFKTSTRIEMLKEISLEAISEIGIVTRSDREVPLHRVTKFYGKAFEWNHRQSVYARTLTHRPHPTRTHERSVFMTFFGVGREQMLQIRSRFPKEELPLIWREPIVPNSSTRLGFLILGDPSPPGSEIAGTIQRNFENTEVLSLSEIPGAKAPLPSSLRAVIYHRDLTSLIEKDPRFKDLAKMPISTSTPSDEELRQNAKAAIDTLVLPLERVSFFKKLAIQFPELKPVEEIAIHSYRRIESLEVGQPIDVTEVSESGLTMKYERELPLGTIRRFVLWQPAEAGLPFLTARCYLSLPQPDGNALNYFVFFGMSDAEIKYVRVWMRDHYIMDKNKSSS